MIRERVLHLAHADARRFSVAVFSVKYSELNSIVVNQIRSIMLRKTAVCTHRHLQFNY
jgi:hypothetical protein